MGLFLPNFPIDYFRHFRYTKHIEASTHRRDKAMFSNIEIEAAIRTAVDKIVTSGMSEAEAKEYVNNNLETILAWCLKLMTEAKGA